MNFQPLLPKGSLILITGINGFVASHVANEFLQRGYRIRGTARDEQKALYMGEMYHSLYGADAFEPVVVPDLNAEGALDEAVKGW
jgi:nucleoside-diphosphate-sugar epimerase